MQTIPDELRRRLCQHGQEHVLTGWERLDASQRAQFVAQLDSLDLDELQRLHARRHAKDAIPEFRRLASLPQPVESAAQLAEYRRLGEKAMRAGEVAFLVVAGGQGTRLGFDHPKGMFPVGPVSGKSLYQLHAEKVLAFSRRYGKPFPFLVLTSSATRAETEEFIANEHDYFGLDPNQVDLLCQRDMPALDFDSGKLLLEAPGKLALSPNGHGGTLAALRGYREFDVLEWKLVRTIFYFQVDNPLTDLGDLEFLGRHLAQRAEVSTKILPKKHPKEKMGNLVLVDGNCSIIEYSDLPDDWANRQTTDGNLFFWAGNTAIHLFHLQFLQRVAIDPVGIPWHLAKKKVPYLGPDGKLGEPARENALKFERFIFDVLPLAERWTVAATTRARDFEPLKNATGDDSPDTVRRALIHQAATWLEQAGVTVPRDAQGQIASVLEISPLFALDSQELQAKIKPGLRIGPSLYLA